MPITQEDFAEFITYATTLGNSSVILVVTLLCSIWLASSRYLHAAAALWISFVLTAILTVTAKLFLLGCIEDKIFGMHSPSGHAALALATYGMLGILFSQATQGFFRSLINLIFVFLIISIAFSRVFLGYHSVAEVLVGLVCGFIGLIIASTYFFNWKRELLRFNVLFMLIVLAGIGFFVRGVDIPAETWIKRLAPQLKDHIEFCAPQASQDGSTSRDNSSS